jgi:hypothetical protein
MPDLTIETFWCCESCFQWERKVVGSKGATYVVRWGRDHKRHREYEYDYSCNCMSYRTRPGYCKHIEAVKGERCGWDQWQDGGGDIPLLGDGRPRCPKCGGPATAHKVAV